MLSVTKIKGENNPVFICPYCDNEYVLDELSSFHIKEVPNDKMISFSCTECGSIIDTHIMKNKEETQLFLIEDKDLENSPNLAERVDIFADKIINFKENLSKCDVTDFAIIAKYNNKCLVVTPCTEREHIIKEFVKKKDLFEFDINTVILTEDVLNTLDVVIPKYSVAKIIYKAPDAEDNEKYLLSANSSLLKCSNKKFLPNR